MQPVCPSAGDWQRLCSGDVSDADADRLEGHLETCETCRSLVPSLRIEDPIRQALRGKSPLLPAEKELVEGLIHRVKNLLQTSSAAQALSGKPSDDPDRFRGALTAGEECRLGSYRLVRLLGSGGMGLVFEAVDETLQRRVAVKVMAPKLAASTAARQRFLREARAVAALDHPNIVPIYQVGDDDGAPFFVMEFLEGETLAERLLKTPRPTPQESAAIGRQIAEGLAAAHAQGLIHRDIKPANIWLAARDKGQEARGKQSPGLAPHASPLTPCVKILDFGLVYQADDDARLTRVGDVVGTPAYMSPEQARGECLDVRADVFSLGCLLYELCTGFTPFQAINSTALLLPPAANWPKPPRELNPCIPVAMSQLMVAMLAKHPEERPASAQQVADALRAVEEGRATIPGVTTGIERSQKRPLSRRTVLALVAMMLVVAPLVWFLPGWFFPSLDSRPLSGSWSKGEPLALARTNAMAVEMGSRLYLMGGDIKEHHLDTLEMLDTDTGVWKSLAPMPRTDTGDNGRSAASVGVIDGKLYLAGGWRHRPPLPTKTLLIYDPQANTWDIGPPMPTLSGDSAGGVIDRKFYVLVGSNGHDGLRHLFYAYDPDQKTWKELKPAPRAHAQAAAGVIGNKLYVVGGNGGMGPSGGLDVYDPADDVWTSLAPMPTPRVAPAAAVLNGKLVVLGGTNGSPLATMEAYDPGTDRWTSLPDLPDARVGATATVVGSTLYLLGGHRLGSNLAALDLFTLSANSR